MNAINPQNWTTISWNGMDWVVAKGYEKYIPSLLWEKTDQPETFPDCHLLKRSILRTSFLVTLDQETLFVKRHHRKNRLDDLRNMIMPSRAFNEWNVLRQFKRLGLPAPEPLAYGEKRRNGILQESCVVTSAFLAAEPIASLLSETDSPQARVAQKDLVGLMANLIARMHNYGVYFRDLHGGNILGRYDRQKHLELFFVDTDKARVCATIKRRHRIDDLILLFVSVFHDKALLWKTFLSLYCGASKNLSITEQSLDTAVNKGAQKYLHRRLKSRSKRCLKNSTSFGIEKTKRSILYVRKSVPRPLIDEALEQARTVIADPKEFSTGRTTSWTVSVGNTPETIFQVTGYRYSLREQLLSIWRRTKAKAAWVSENALLVRNIATHQPLALYEKKGLVGTKYSVLLVEGK